MSGVQLPLETQHLGALPLDPHELAALNAPARGRLYDDLDLDLLQRHAAEDAVRLVFARECRSR